ncbi:bile acid:sodium symporter [Corynebacterium callunae]
MISWWNKYQIPLYLGALGVGALIGLVFQTQAPAFDQAINPILMVLLYATFLAVPLNRLGRALTDLRFLAGLLVLNFLAVPVVVFVLTRAIADEPAILVGVLLVLLAPCIDYVIVFSGLAGSANEKLLAASPLLMLLQMLLIPVYIRLIMGPEILNSIDVGSFIRAFMLLIVVPLAAALLTQILAQRFGWARRVMTLMEAMMVPVMMLTLAVVVASQIAAVSGQVGMMLQVIPLFAIFMALMATLGKLAGKIFNQDVPATRALIFSGATRNSLVVLPLALALPAELSIAAIVVVSQTLVELVGMIIFVRAVPKFVPESVPASQK